MIVAQDGSQSNVTINSKSLGYINLGTWNAHSGYTYVNVSLDLIFGMSNYTQLVNGGLCFQPTSPYALYVRVYNNGTAAATGTVSWTAFWAKYSYPSNA